MKLYSILCVILLYDFNYCNIKEFKHIYLFNLKVIILFYSYFNRNYNFIYVMLS